MSATGSISAIISGPSYFVGSNARSAEVATKIVSASRSRDQTINEIGHSVENILVEIKAICPCTGKVGVCQQFLSQLRDALELNDAEMLNDVMRELFKMIKEAAPTGIDVSHELRHIMRLLNELPEPMHLTPDVEALFRSAPGNESATLAATPVDVAAAPAPVPSSAVPEPIPQGAVSVQEPEPESSPVLAAATGKSPDAPKVPPPAVKIILTQIEELLKPELLILDVVQTEPALSQPNPGGKLPNMVKDGPLPVQIRVTPEPLAKPALLGEKSDLGSVVLRVDPATVTPAPTSEKPAPAPTSSVIIKAVGALAEASRSPVVPERSTSTPGSPPPTGNPGSVPAAASPSSGPSVLAGPNVIFKLMDTAVRQLPDRVQEMVISKIQTVWDHQPEAALRLVKAIEQMPGASAKEVSLRLSVLTNVLRSVEKADPIALPRTAVVLSDIMTAPVPHLTDIGKVIVNVSRAEPAVLPVVLDLIQTVAARQPETLPVIARAVNQIIARQPDIVAQSSMPKNVVAQTVQLLANAANSEARPATVGALIAESHVRLPAAATTTPASGPGLSLPVGSRLEAIATAIVRTAKEAPQVLAETVRTFESIILAESSLSDSKSPMASGHEMAIELPTPHLDFSIHTARVQTEFVADLIKSTTLPARHSEPLNQLIRAVSQLGNAKYEAAVVQISRLTVEHPKLAEPLVRLVTQVAVKNVEMLPVITELIPHITSVPEPVAAIVLPALETLVMASRPEAMPEMSAFQGSFLERFAEARSESGPASRPSGYSTEFVSIPTPQSSGEQMPRVSQPVGAERSESTVAQTVAKPIVLASESPVSVAGTARPSTSESQLVTTPQFNSRAEAGSGTGTPIIGKGADTVPGIPVGRPSVGHVGAASGGPVSVGSVGVGSIGSPMPASAQFTQPIPVGIRPTQPIPQTVRLVLGDSGSGRGVLMPAEQIQNAKVSAQLLALVSATKVVADLPKSVMIQGATLIASLGQSGSPALDAVVSAVSLLNAHPPETIQTALSILTSASHQSADALIKVANAITELAKLVPGSVKDGLQLLKQVESLSPRLVAPTANLISEIAHLAPKQVPGAVALIATIGESGLPALRLAVSILPGLIAESPANAESTIKAIQSVLTGNKADVHLVNQLIGAASRINPEVTPSLLRIFGDVAIHSADSIPNFSEFLEQLINSGRLPFLEAATGMEMAEQEAKIRKKRRINPIDNEASELKSTDLLASLFAKLEMENWELAALFRMRLRRRRPSKNEAFALVNRT